LSAEQIATLALMMSLLLRGSTIAGSAIFEAGGNRLLSVGMRTALREVVERVAAQGVELLAAQAPNVATMGTRLALESTNAVLKSAGVDVAEMAVKSAARTLAQQGGKEVMKSAGIRVLGAGVGAGVIDGVVATVSYVQKCRAGDMSTGRAVATVGIEIGTGAAAGAAGTAAVVATCALLGPVGWAAGLGIAIVAATGAKLTTRASVRAVTGV
jgi:hypothetical protein